MVPESGGCAKDHSCFCTYHDECHTNGLNIIFLSGTVRHDASHHSPLQGLSACCPSAEVVLPVPRCRSPCPSGCHAMNDDHARTWPPASPKPMASKLQILLMLFSSSRVSMFPLLVSPRVPLPCFARGFSATSFTYEHTQSLISLRFKADCCEAPAMSFVSVCVLTRKPQTLSATVMQIACVA